jgi:hypothetical protein
MQYEIPSRSFNITEEHNPIEVINKLTNGFSNISKNTEQDILSRICNRKKPTIFGKFKAPSKPIADKINGKDGYFLEKTMHDSNIDLIWYDDIKSEYLFWGSSIYKVSDAMSRIRYRIIKHKPEPAPAEQEQEPAEQESAQQESAQQEPAEQEPAEQEQAPAEQEQEPAEQEQEPSIAGTPPPRDEKPYTQQIFRSIGERHGDTDHITDAEIEYIAIIRDVFKDDSYSKKLFELMDKGDICKRGFIRQHDLYTDSLFKNKYGLMEKLLANLQNIKN